MLPGYRTESDFLVNANFRVYEPEYAAKKRSCLERMNPRVEMKLEWAKHVPSR
jgi:hypothetical protein